jgi:hypothetical protein
MISPYKKGENESLALWTAYATPGAAKVKLSLS